MCFYSTRSAKAKIAKTDIECWKILFPSGVPRFVGIHNNGDKYKKMVKSKRIIIAKNSKDNIHEGYHSYKSLKITEREFKNYPGFYCGGEIISKFIIPKGTIYYSNHSEYVSETIMLVE